MGAGLVYRIDWRPGTAHPGHHRSRAGGPGQEFSHHTDLLRAPDPRRFDVPATLRDPAGGLRFRVFRQMSAVPVWLLADVSASMAFAGKLRTLADFADALGESAWITGDPFGYVACDLRPRPDLLQPARLQRGLGARLAGRLRELTPEGAGAQGLLAAAPLLGRQRALVFLASDFHLPLALTERLPGTLARHDVVPVVCWDEDEYEDLPAWGWCRLRDPETGAERRRLLRPALADAVRRRYRRRWQTLSRLFRRRPLRLGRHFSPLAVTRYFHG